MHLLLMSSSTYLLYELALHSMLTRLAGKTAVIQEAEVILCQLPAKIDEPPWFNVPSIWINLWGMGEYGGRGGVRTPPICTRATDDAHSIILWHAG